MPARPRGAARIAQRAAQAALFSWIDAPAPPPGPAGYCTAKPPMMDAAMSAPLPAALLALLASALLAPPEAARAQSRPVYRCSGNLYTDAIDAAEARQRGCSPIEAAVSLPVPAAPRATAATPRASAAPADGTTARVDPAVQRVRDADKRRILEAELAAEQQRLAGLQRELDAVQAPARPGEAATERSTRAGLLRESIERSQADLAALRRELAKTAGGPV